MERIHQKFTTEQKIQMLTTDFQDRDQTTFVKIRRQGRLGWESAIPEGTPYSDYILSPASDEELIRNSYRLAEDMIKIMDTPVKVRVRYPKTIDMNDLEEFADTLLEIRPLLTPYPTSTAQCVETVEKIFDIIKDYLKEEEKQKQKESASG